jgi:hypothetical protein
MGSFITCTLYQSLGKDDEMCRAYSTRGWDGDCTQFCSDKLKGTDLGLDVGIILEWILNK